MDYHEAIETMHADAGSAQAMRRDAGWQSLVGGLVGAAIIMAVFWFVVR